MPTLVLARPGAAAGPGRSPAIQVQDLRAHVRWTSAPGQGSEMRLRLPGTLLM
ncbi:hypothetical protein [Massilia genomosp. 1]|uniref:hypothetical protein n=1 Tax=Massilia genomosp. 1 TaxID=2609280 RepID=UPI001421C810|nr:hypothetical protein [Massilia genomosp. 1]